MSDIEDEDDDVKGHLVYGVEGEVIERGDPSYWVLSKENYAEQFATHIAKDVLDLQDSRRPEGISDDAFRCRQLEELGKRFMDHLDGVNSSYQTNFNLTVTPPSEHGDVDDVYISGDLRHHYKESLYSLRKILTEPK